MLQIHINIHRPEIQVDYILHIWTLCVQHKIDLYFMSSRTGSTMETSEVLLSVRLGSCEELHTCCSCHLSIIWMLCVGAVIILSYLFLYTVCWLESRVCFTSCIHALWLYHWSILKPHSYSKYAHHIFKTGMSRGFRWDLIPPIFWLNHIFSWQSLKFVLFIICF